MDGDEDESDTGVILKEGGSGPVCYYSPKNDKMLDQSVEG